MAESMSFALEQLSTLPLVCAVPAGEPARQTFVYRSLAGVQLLADIYCPPALTATQRCSAVIMVHAGPVSKQASPKDWRMFRDYAALLAGLGLITIVFNHRLHGPAEYFTAQGDVIALLDHVRERAASYRIDADRLVLWSFGGSGPLLTVALDPRRRYICGLIAYYCLLDFAAAGRREPSAPREILETLSPATQLRRYGCSASILLARAGRDSAEVNRSLASFLEAALSSEAAVELLNHPEGVPGFDVRNDDGRSREIIGRTLEFIRARAGAEWGARDAHALKL